MSNLCRNINQEKGAKSITFYGGWEGHERPIPWAFGTNSIPDVMAASGSQEVPDHACPLPLGPGKEGQIHRTQHFADQKISHLMELFILSGLPRFSADLYGQCSIWSPQMELCEHPLASGSFGSLQRYLWLPWRSAPRLPGHSAYKPRGLRVPGDRTHPGTALEGPAQGCKS